MIRKEHDHGKIQAEKLPRIFNEFNEAIGVHDSYRETFTLRVVNTKVTTLSGSDRWRVKD